MISQRHSDTVAREASLGLAGTGADELAALTAAVGVAVGRCADWRGRIVAELLLGILRADRAAYLASEPTLPARGARFGLTDLLLATDAQ